MKLKLKKDRYFRERGKSAKMIRVSCFVCGNFLLLYQKDGPGWLKRLYLNRIYAPEEYACLQRNLRIKTPRDLQPLYCSCGALIGSPMVHKDGRLAFHLVRGAFKRAPYRGTLVD